MMTKVIQFDDFRFIDLALGGFVRNQHAAADLNRVLERLQSRRRLQPFVMAKVRVRRTAGDDQVVIRHFTVEQMHYLCARIDRRRLAQDHARIALPPQYAPYRRRDIGRIQSSSRDLVEQRLKKVMVAPIDHSQSHRRALERTRGGNSTESPADDHDVRCS